MKKNSLFVAGILALALVFGMALIGCKNDVSPVVSTLPTVTLPTVSDLEAGFYKTDEFTVRIPLYMDDTIAFKATVRPGTNPVNKVYITIKKHPAGTLFSSGTSTPKSPITSPTNFIIIDEDSYFNLVVGDYRVEWYVTDTNGNKSNTVSTTFSVSTK